MGFNKLAKKLEKMAADWEFMAIVKELNSYAKNRPEYKTTYGKLNNMYMSKYHAAGQNMMLYKTNEQTIYNYELTSEEVAKLQRQPFLEVHMALRHHTGHKITSFDTEEKQRISPKIRKLIMNGFGLDERIGFVNGVPEQYIAKVVNIGKFPSAYTVILKLTANIL
jgi:hypothetical protein